MLIEGEDVQWFVDLGEELGVAKFEARSQANIVEASRQGGWGGVEATGEMRGEGEEQRGKVPRVSPGEATQVAKIKARRLLRCRLEVMPIMKEALRSRHRSMGSRRNGLASRSRPHGLSTLVNRWKLHQADWGVNIVELAPLDAGQGSMGAKEASIATGHDQVGAQAVGHRARKQSTVEDSGSDDSGQITDDLVR
ncbi:unnamed protein product [Ilex paraguariensis]|uniref:Uncharacterized protein n=1 Tax=Ilex paraguariensis TaxID=185542 RepID=A0ABC8SWE7_9AQUA